MARAIIQGFAIVRRAWLSRSYEVCGIGQDTPAAWKDAAETHTQGRLDARTMLVEHPEMTCVEAKITVNFDKPEAR